MNEINYTFRDFGIYILKVAFISNINPRQDFMFHLFINDVANIHEVISGLNKNITGGHCELVSITEARHGKHEA